MHPVDFQRDTMSIRNIIVVATQGALPSRPFLLERWNEVREEHPGRPT